MTTTWLWNRHGDEFHSLHPDIWTMRVVEPRLVAELWRTSRVDGAEVGTVGADNANRTKTLRNARSSLAESNHGNQRFGDVARESARQQLGDQRLSFLGALVAQKALHRFLAPHKGLLSKLALRRFSRLSLSVDGSFSLPLHIEPTYQLGPRKPFTPASVLPVVEDVVLGRIDQTFAGVGDVNTAILAQNLSNEVRIAVKGLGPARYKYVVYTVITKDIGQSMLAASRVLWSPEFDSQFSIQQRKDEYIIHVNVFACYHD